MITLSRIEVTEDAVIEPVTLQEVKDWCMEDSVDRDALLNAIQRGARQDIENIAALKLVPCSVSMYVNTSDWDDRVSVFPFAFELSWVEITSIARIINGAAPEAQARDIDYYFDDALVFGSFGKFRVVYTITPIIPQSLKEAVLMLTAYRYNNRGDQVIQQGIPHDILSKVAKYQQQWL